MAFPLYGPEFSADPYPTYRRLRESGPVHRVEFPSGVHGWLVTGYHAARQTLTDPRLGKNHALGNDRWRRLAAIMPEPQHTQLQAHLLHQDPPKHTVIRKLITETLTPRRVEALDDRLTELAERMIRDAPAGGPVDLVAGFAGRFPFAVLAEVIGLEEPLRSGFRREWGKVVQPVGPRSPLRGTYERLLRELQSYIHEVVAAKRADLGDDLLSRLVEATDAGALTPDELSSTVFQLLVAGQEPVTNQLTTAVVALLRDPGALTALRADPALLGRGVDELMRYDGAFELTTWRFFGADADLHGTRIPAGDSVIVSLAAANRDPAAFADPDRLDLGRPAVPHLGFGHGAHYCPGAALGRAELRAMLAALLPRLPDPAPPVPDELDWIPAVLTRGVQHLPIPLRPDAPPSAPVRPAP